MLQDDRRHSSWWPFDRFGQNLEISVWCKIVVWAGVISNEIWKFCGCDSDVSVYGQRKDTFKSQLCLSYSRMTIRLVIYSTDIPSSGIWNCVSECFIPDVSRQRFLCLSAFEMRPLSCFKTSATKYPVTKCRIAGQLMPNVNEARRPLVFLGPQFGNPIYIENSTTFI